MREGYVRDGLIQTIEGWREEEHEGKGIGGEREEEVKLEGKQNR